MIKQFILQLNETLIPNERRLVLDKLIGYIIHSLLIRNTVHLTFICTHNSRRSQLAQVWAKTLAEFYGISIRAFSGGTEVTACHPNTVRTLENIGFKVNQPKGENPVYEVSSDVSEIPARLFSKYFNHSENPEEHFAAIMTCDHADANCPFIPGADVRIQLNYADPKSFDDKPEQDKAYLACSAQIANELNYVFKNVAKNERGT